MRTVVLAVLALLVTPSIASGAPFSIGPGTLPNVAVDPAGVAYLAYNGLEAGGPPHFCRLPRGASACDVALTLPVPAGTDTTSRPVVTVAGARVTILQHRSGQSNAINEWTSIDGGVTFPSQRVAGGNVPNAESVSGPNDSVLVVTNADFRGGLLESVPLTGGTPTTTFATLYDTSRPYNGTVGMIDGTTPLALFADLNSQGAFRRYTGTGDVNSEANWTPSTDVGFVSYPRLAGGPSGLFMISGDESSGLFVRRFDGTTFGPRVALTSTGDASEMFLTQDPAGRLQAVWSSNLADGFHVVHAVSDDGVNWRSGTVSVQTDDEPGAMRIAAAPDHVGVAAWSSRVATGSEIRVASTGPDAPVDAAPPPAPTPVAPPVPVFGKTVVLRPVSGKVRVRLKGSKTFVDLTTIDDVPFGSTVDTKRGRVELASVPSRAGALQKIQLYDGQFSLAQKGSVTEFALNEPLAACGKRSRVAAAKPKSRKLWGDGKGKFRTKGQYSAATVRGTRWLVQDSCAGTLTQVKQGSVLVTAGKKRIVLRAGKRYLARRRG
ncbi:hypothetical protein OM076_13235 [Solirubrobacter ginsenosidimutans]|uniref:Uncharacterized protein n=1 Tax=Solirubrobacter ginsenosidimutans TaxID=490573 RepID=A0A9X3S2J5_9ACTN|nr:hypothetical protein [Solirubrobacter ginsenosidimutans]MDA0161236.1 hypothetical protein [Solirubrobacter ginsenosidimutans]